MFSNVTPTSYALAVGLPGMGSKITTPVPEQGRTNEVGKEAATPYRLNVASDPVTLLA